VNVNSFVTLTSVKPLFDDDVAIPKTTLVQEALEDFKLNNLTGIQEQKMEISFNPDGGGDILIKVIDPHAATGYLVFQDEEGYKSWLNAQLYEPSQDEIQEAASRGQRS
jgi:hypothetical protein